MLIEVEADTGRAGNIPVIPAAIGHTNGVDERAMLHGYCGELDLYYEAAKGFSSQEPDVVLQQIAAFSARLCEIRARLQRIDSARTRQLRTREVEPLMEQMDFQFRIASRLLSAREFEFKASGGGV